MRPESNLQTIVGEHGQGGGIPPLIRASAARFGFNMISAVSARGDMRFQVIRGRVGASQFLDFLKRLNRSVDRKIFLILDGHPIHKARMVKNYVKETEGKLNLFFLPPYSPELNPDEQVWNDLKGRGLAGKISSGPEDLLAKVACHLRSLPKVPERVMKFFRLPETKYAWVQSVALLMNLAVYTCWPGGVRFSAG